MDLSSSYFHRLFDLAAPLGSGAAQAAALGSGTAQAEPLASPVEFFEEAAEVEASFDEEISFEEPNSFHQKKSEPDKVEGPARGNLQENVFNPPHAIATKKRNLEKTDFSPSIKKTVPGQEAAVAEAFREIENVIDSNIVSKMGALDLMEPDIISRPASTSPMEEKTSQKVLNPFSPAVEEFFEKRLRSPEVPLEEDFGDSSFQSSLPFQELQSERDMKEVVEPLLDLSSERGTSQVVFTTEQRQVIQHTVQVALEGFEKKAAQKEEPSSFLKINSAPARPLWRGWSGRCGFPGRLK